jgi:hypothetical protein
MTTFSLPVLLPTIKEKPAGLCAGGVIDWLEAECDRGMIDKGIRQIGRQGNERQRNAILSEE